MLNFKVEQKVLESIVEKLYELYPSGYLTKDDIEKRIQTSFPSKKIVNHFVKILDKDSDGKVSIVEFVEFLIRLKYGTPQKRLEFIFKLFDANQSGRLSRPEVAQIATMILIMNNNNNTKPTKSNVVELTERIFSRCDTDRSSEIDYNEFCDIAKKEFQLTEKMLEMSNFDELMKNI